MAGTLSLTAAAQTAPSAASGNATTSVLAANTTVTTNTASGNATATDANVRPARTGNRGPMPANPKLPDIILIGDSTVRNGAGTGGGGQWGWGEPLAALFDKEKVNVVNRAVGGLSSRTYLTGGYWDRALALVKPGDIVLMQFGHNDGGAINDATRARASIKGVGDETQEIDNLLTKKHETVHSYGWYLRKFIDDTKAKGATPIVCTLIPRNNWKDGKVVRNANDYAGWAAQVAKAENVGLIDLNELIARKYDALGQEKVQPLFIVGAGPHTSLEGAQLNAEVVVAGLKALKPDPAAAYYSEKGAKVAPAEDVTKPEAATPAAGAGNTTSSGGK
jgi:lysophospholipase L1-like esterase